MTHAAPANDYRVLILPPTRRDGEVTCEVLDRAGLACLVCNDPAALAREIRGGSGAVILTDALNADGASLILEALRDQPAWSDTPIILLSRASRENTLLPRLVAELTSITILDRPTSSRTLVSSLQAAVRGRRRQYQLRDHLSALEQAEDALRIADHRKDEFLAMLAHELRNPLAPIRTASELLARTLPPESRAHGAVNIVKRQVTHLTRMVDDLLDVSRITQGRIQLQRQPLEVGDMLAQAVESVEPLIREKRHRINRIAAPQPLYVDADSARLVQCVTNLLINAVKYTDSGGNITTEVRLDAGCAVISVADDGIGISTDLLPRVFDLFVQSERSLDRSEGGLGIGLSVVRRLVEMQDGSVTARSAGPGRGATFEIRLPLIEAPAPSDVAAESHAVRAKRILIVDDNADAASCLAECLRLDGHEVCAVFNAADALRSAGTFMPNLILLDIGLPDMDGYEVAAHIRRSGVTARLVALTGYGQSEDVARTRRAGFDAHLVKPVDLNVLERVIAQPPLERPAN